ncbi:hypothetical protein KC19_VG282600 [Ceratodon purpureus]|uniref:Uncharacterized protein n=1 Tax=Ceratodon purpureus TaxID=3225 RepID=A0A8T0HUZ9_CERPU|nr:hypothetical protein KC19_VG282600 [Ceratodon purpureus]
MQMIASLMVLFMKSSMAFSCLQIVSQERLVRITRVQALGM